MKALVESARRKGSPLVVGLDPVPARLPDALKDIPEPRAALEFCLGVLEAVGPHAAAVKPQAAFFERLGPEGLEVYAALIAAARDLDLPVIADVKRGDIGPVAAAYAEAHLRRYGAHAVTVNPYMGADAVEPFLKEARDLDAGGGVFVLVATSNPSSDAFQNSTDPPLHEISARLVADLGRKDGDYLDAGAVVGATRPAVGRRVRELLPDALFLCPGYGAQGGAAKEILPLLDADGAGVLINSSRAILYAHEDTRDDFRKASREAASRAKEDLLRAGVRV